MCHEKVPEKSRVGLFYKKSLWVKMVSKGFAEKEDKWEDSGTSFDACRCPLTPPSNSHTGAGCYSSAQSNSIYLQGSVPQDIPTADASHKWNVQATHTSVWSQTQVFPQTPSLGLIISLEWLTKLRKALYLHQPVYYKGYNSSMEEMLRAR